MSTLSESDLEKVSGPLGKRPAAAAKRQAEEPTTER
jgi:hypothetical protein